LANFLQAEPRDYVVQQVLATGLVATPGADEENPSTTHAVTATASVTNYDITTQAFEIT